MLLPYWPVLQLLEKTRYAVKLNVVGSTSAMNKLRELDTRTSSIDEMKEILTPVFCGYKVRAPQFEPGTSLFRARICDKPSKFRELLYPPPDRTRLNRVNREGAPVLYCCAARQSTIFETRPSVGSMMAIVQLVTTAKMLVNHVGYTTRAFETLGSSRTELGWAGREEHQILHGEGQKEIDEFLSEIFTRRITPGDEHHNKLTIAVAEKLFASDLFDGLKYPTVAMQANGDNYALKPKYADANLSFVKAESARVDAVYDDSYDITVIDTASDCDTDGRINWKGRLEQWNLGNQCDSLCLRVENGQWVAYNVDGSIREPE